ncbi:uncharacterized protein K460DRAFT_358334 [Cucurbitaria berberidis CBS 394.84]|uniref:Uncharacterized protein n=1 Tax=Cucurbitaria berberidis CBS 394.84 TaxID=1168544 RepID=A0A9P4G9Z4_9PLEO|nr:uncharacterized protein K460DRAFT_358334 [Cucurbitaria berberidis CBS 394.84]KAF1841602.1 hypothetical protein K460DRAFT_358334 [Cucurbitaria berberidis CBS 394.84]
MTVVQKNFVNLGNLYTRIKVPRPPGWAYFDDGSIFIVPYGWLPHHGFEKRMSLAASFISSPSPKIQAIRQEDPLRSRLILINKDGRDLKHNTFHILARNAYNNQRLSVVGLPFEDIALKLDESGSHPTSAQFKEAPQLKIEHRLRNSEALRTFRGTFIDGTLHPNVRLGNGLLFSSNAGIRSPQMREKRQLRDLKVKARRKSLDLPNRAPAEFSGRWGVNSSMDRHRPAQEQGVQLWESQMAEKDPFSQEIPPPTPGARSPSSTLESGDTENEAEVRELEQRMEIIRWKRRSLELERKLAMATRRRASTTRERYQTNRDTPQHKPEGSLQAPVKSTGDVFSSNGFDFDDESPPEALARLRSRIQLPTRNKLRSRGV